MRTTVDLPDELYRQAKAQAALSGITLKELITRWVERGLRSGDLHRPEPQTRTRELPDIIAPCDRAMPTLTNADISRILDAEEAAD